MDGGAVFLVISLVLAVLFTIVTIVKYRRGDEKTDEDTEEEEDSAGGLLKLPNTIEIKSRARKPEDATVIYSDMTAKPVRRCENCGCEYEVSVTECDICGSRL